MKILVFTTLFPNAQQPRHGVFIAERLRHLRQHFPGVELLVVAPVPWFPFRGHRFGAYGAYARVAAEEVRDGVRVLHPRYPVIPKIGMPLAPLLLTVFMRSILKRIKSSVFDYELIDAHYLYPDGIAATAIGRDLDVPVIVTARGTDLNLYPKMAFPAAMLRKWLPKADAVGAVCEALIVIAKRLAPSQEEFHVLRNGVDLEKFSPVPRESARHQTGISGYSLLAVGHLIERKGPHLVIEALRELPDVNLVFVGDGPMKGELERLAKSLDVATRVRFVGAVPHQDLPAWYSAADALVLASSREGWANVLLEAMACGTPVVATGVDGTPEVVCSPDAGVLMSERSASGVVEAVRQLRASRPLREATRSHAEQFSWDATSVAQYRLFERLILKSAKPSPAAPG